jgi:hypothetical protein
MPVGNTTSRPQIDSTAGTLCRQIEIWTDQVLNFKQYLDGATDAELMADPFNYAQADVDLLRAGFDDLAQLARIFQGSEALAVAKDFGLSSRQMAGLVLS